MLGFLKSLCFWRYRALYLALLAEHAAAGYDVQQNYWRSLRARQELCRLYAILAPYGEKILTGQADDTEGALLLPALEFEMAKAFFACSERLSSDSGRFELGASTIYSWRGRVVRCIG